MTQEEIDAMPAGPEMDVLIAEQVIGEHVHRFDQEIQISRVCPTCLRSVTTLLCKCGVQYVAAETCRKCNPDNPYIPPLGLRSHVALYSTDIGAAWEIVEKMYMTIYTPGSSYASGEYGWGNSYAAETRNGERSEASAAPLAICRAALKARMKTV